MSAREEYHREVVLALCVLFHLLSRSFLNRGHLFLLRTEAIFAPLQHPIHYVLIFLLWKVVMMTELIDTEEGGAVMTENVGVAQCPRLKSVDRIPIGLEHAEREGRGGTYPLDPLHGVELRP